MESNTCKNCRAYTPKDVSSDTKGAFGICTREPFQLRDASEDQFAVMCGHDSMVYVGQNFGCIFFMEKDVG